jgi:hypothetical protein
MSAAMGKKKVMDDKKAASANSRPNASYKPG